MFSETIYLYWLRSYINSFIGTFFFGGEGTLYTPLQRTMCWNTWDSVRNTAIRFCTGPFRSSPVVNLYTESGEPPLSLRRDLLILQYNAHSHQIHNSPVYNRVRGGDDGAAGHSGMNNISIRIDFIEENTNHGSMKITPIFFNSDPTWNITASYSSEFDRPSKSNIDSSYEVAVSWSPPKPAFQPDTFIQIDPRMTSPMGVQLYHRIDPFYER